MDKEIIPNLICIRIFNRTTKSDYMKQIALLSLIISMTALSYGQQKIKKLEVKEGGYNININFQPEVDEITHDGLTYKITPISTDRLNSIFLMESNHNGKFEYSQYEQSRNSFFLKRRKTKREKSDIEFSLEGVSWLVENEKLSKLESQELVNQIRLYYSKNTENEINDLNRIIISNPYYIQNRYLSVFKFEISNPSNSHMIFDNRITIESGNLILKPLSTSQISEELIRINLYSVDKALTLERHNLPYSISIPPTSKFEKLFAVPPIDFNNNTLTISLSGVDQKFRWTVVKNEKKIDDIYIFYEIAIDWNYGGTISKSGDNIVLLKSKQSSVFLGANELFIGEDYLNEQFEIFTLSLYSDMLYYGKESLKGIDFLDIVKGRRSRISIRTKPITQLVKKVKE